MVTGPIHHSAAKLNESCQCIALDENELERALKNGVHGIGLAELTTSHPNLFSRVAFFVEHSMLTAMREVVAAVERVVALPQYRELALSTAHFNAQHDPRTRGVFMGYDFHLSESGPQLIEINTNAGGALLNTLLRTAQRACCEPVAKAFGVRSDLSLSDFFPMFREEWRLARGERPLRSVAIVDDQPESQFLYPEFLLFKHLVESEGLSCIVADATALRIEGQTLTAQGHALDLVYNRSTDFTLSAPEHAALREAYLRDFAVVTPHPHAHALYADKRRLALLSDRDALSALGAASEDVDLLERHVPRTRIVDSAQREQLWAERKQLFFKPQSGYGSKATYRGDKITKTVFEQILNSTYVAQALVPPSGRMVGQAAELRELKADVRNFAYAGQVQLVCARLYQGQTTNFRTQGGGFAPVYDAG